MIKLKNIELTLNKNSTQENKIFSNFNLEVNTGKWTVIVGSNGAGKSTLMNLIAGDLIPDSGSVIIGSQDMTHLSCHQRAKSISRVFQDPNAGTFAELTVEENLCIAKSRGEKRSLKLALNSSQREALREQLLKFNIGLENKLDNAIGTLSGGQRQVISLLMCTMQPAKILLLDEHTAALDPSISEKVMAATEYLITQHKLTTLMITHSILLAKHYGAEIICLHQGQIVKTFNQQAKSNLSSENLSKYLL
jgi:putative tryptophan/tyrosine transport system ATP-binding protein